MKTLITTLLCTTMILPACAGSGLPSTIKPSRIGHTVRPAPSPPKTAPVPAIPNLTNADRIVFAGDSISWLGQNSTNSAGWIIQFQQFAQQTYPGLTVFDAGVPGDTSTQLLARFATVLSCNPTIVVIEIGTNDISHLVSANTTSLNVDQMIANCAQAGVREIILVPTECIHENGSSPLEPAINTQQANYMAIAAAHNPPVFAIPMHTYLQSVEYYLNPHLHLAQGILTYDGMHPTALGNAFLRNVYLHTFGLPIPKHVAGAF